MEFQVDDYKFSGEIDLSDTIKIKSSTKMYDVFYNDKTLDALIREIYQFNDFIFIDRNVYNLDPSAFTTIDNNYILIFDALETNKTIENVLELTDKLYNINFTKKNTLLVIGGGITQDVGGFAAAMYKRGINWIYIPTTVLSMTDSCIGSKVNVNRVSKNILGLFCAPNSIHISTCFLNSLNNDDIISGIGEALKLTLIGGPITYKLFMDKWKQKNKDYISIIKLASLVKRPIIEYDEFETHTRKTLNYGHTIGHAIEGTTNYYIPHGIAVLIGMFINNKLFYDDKYEEINSFILELINPKYFEIKFNYGEFIKHILSDKKNRGNDVCFIVLNEIGKTNIIYKNITEIDIKLRSILSELMKEIV